MCPNFLVERDLYPKKVHNKVRASYISFQAAYSTSQLLFLSWIYFSTMSNFTQHQSRGTIETGQQYIFDKGFSLSLFRSISQLQKTPNIAGIKLFHYFLLYFWRDLLRESLADLFSHSPAHTYHTSLESRELHLKPIINRAICWLRKLFF